MELIPLELFPAGDFLLSSGASGRLVTGVQLILQALSEHYRNIPGTQPSGRFDEPTRLAVIVIQQKSGFEPTGIIDAKTWNRIAQLYNFTSKVIFTVPQHEL